MGMAWGVCLLFCILFIAEVVNFPQNCLKGVLCFGIYRDDLFQKTWRLLSFNSDTSVCRDPEMGPILGLIDKRAWVLSNFVKEWYHQLNNFFELSYL